MRAGFDRLGEDGLRRGAVGYYGNVTFLDPEVGALLEALDALGLRDDTLVVYTSDHGDMIGSAGLSAKDCFYEDAWRVPLLVRHPAHNRPGTRLPALARSSMSSPRSPRRRASRSRKRARPVPPPALRGEPEPAGHHVYGELYGRGAPDHSTASSTARGSSPSTTATATSCRICPRIPASASTGSPTPPSTRGRSPGPRRLAARHRLTTTSRRTGPASDARPRARPRPARGRGVRGSRPWPDTCGGANVIRHSGRLRGTMPGRCSPPSCSSWRSPAQPSRVVPSWWLENLAAAPPARRPDPPHPEAAAARAGGQALLGAGPAALAALAPAPGPRPAGDGRPLAPAGLAALLALEVPPAARAAAAERRGPRADRDDGPGQPAVGQRADPGRAAQAGDRRQQALDPALPAARPRPPAEPDLAHVPGQPRRQRSGRRTCARCRR